MPSGLCPPVHQLPHRVQPSEQLSKICFVTLSSRLDLCSSMMGGSVIACGSPLLMTKSGRNWARKAILKAVKTELFLNPAVRVPSQRELFWRMMRGDEAHHVGGLAVFQFGGEKHALSSDHGTSWVLTGTTEAPLEGWHPCSPWPSGQQKRCYNGTGLQVAVEYSTLPEGTKASTGRIHGFAVWNQRTQAILGKTLKLRAEPGGQGTSYLRVVGPPDAASAIRLAVRQQPAQ